MSLTKFFPCAPVEPITNVEEKLKKEIMKKNSFKISFNNLTEMITYFKDESHKSVKKQKAFEVLSTIMKTIEFFVNFATISTTLIIFVSGFGLVIIQFSTEIARGLRLTGNFHTIYF